MTTSASHGGWYSERYHLAIVCVGVASYDGRSNMDELQVQFLGSGDAFGSGGRLQACLLLDAPGGRLLIDCGASSLVAMKRQGVDPSEIGFVVVSHLHGDHFGGIPFLLLDGQFSRRERPLVVAGPQGVGDRVTAAMEIFFPGSSTVKRRFSVEYVELADRQRIRVGPVEVTPFEVAHASGAPAFALRVEADEKVIAYSGDTEWVESLVDAAADADIFICEAYFASKQVKYHLDLGTLRANVQRLRAKRIILTHMSAEVLGLEDVEYERAEDGLVVSL